MNLTLFIGEVEKRWVVMQAYALSLKVIHRQELSLDDGLQNQGGVAEFFTALGSLNTPLILPHLGQIGD